MSEVAESVDAPMESEGAFNAGEAVSDETVAEVQSMSEAPVLGEAKPVAFTWDSLKATLPEELQQSPYLSNHESLESLVKEYHNAQRLIGGEKIARPKPDSPQEDWDRFYAALGRPESADKYEIQLEIPEGLPWNQELQGAMLEKFHEAGLTQEQANKVLEGYLNQQVEYTQAHQQALEQSTEAAQSQLKEKWGGEYDRNIELARRALKVLAGSEAESLAGTEFGGTLFGSHPGVIQMFANLGARMQGEGFAQGSGTSGFAMSAEQAKVQIEELEMSSSFREAYLNPSHPEHFAVKRKHDALYDVAYGGGEE